jgi:uncharacterized protein YecE (DUF72 family)
MRGVWIGTSGWVYKHWAESFYPGDWPKKDEFQFYTQHFPTVEINATFYRLPSESMVKGWRMKAPDNFIFAVKGSRFITHMKRLIDPKQASVKYFQRIALLKEHTGPILWQLPPNFEKNDVNVDRLKTFLKLVPKKYQHAVEFRHPSWMDTHTMDLLREHNTAHVWLSSQRMPMDFTVTSDFIYLRFHGLEHGAAHDYTADQLKPWAEQLIHYGNKGMPAYVYFNNDWNTRAPLNGKMLIEMVGNLAIVPFSKAGTPPPENTPHVRAKTKNTASPQRKSSRPRRESVLTGK